MVQCTNKPVQSTFSFIYFIVVVSDQNWDHVNCANDHTKRVTEDNVFYSELSKRENCVKCIVATIFMHLHYWYMIASVTPPPLLQPPSTLPHPLPVSL